MAVAAGEEKTQAVQRLKNFFQEIMQEQKKVVWPTREALTQQTTTVIVLVVVLSVYLGAADILCRLFFGLIE